MNLKPRQNKYEVPKADVSKKVKCSLFIIPASAKWPIRPEIIPVSVA